METSTGIFIFTRDFRIVDNTGLLELSKKVKTIIPIFIFTKEQLGKENKYRSSIQVGFMKECLLDLDEKLKQYGSQLFCFFGNSHSKVVEKLLNEKKNISHLFINEDYTPYSLKRETELENICKKKKIIFNKFRDHLLNDPEILKKKDGNPYVKFTPFYNNAIGKYNLPSTKKINSFAKNIKFKNLKLVNISSFLKNFPVNEKISGGRSKAILVLKQSQKKYKTYDDNRNMLCYSTTGLSPYLKFGCLSIREVMNYFVKRMEQENGLIKQLYWREFYYNIAINFPKVLDDSGTKNFNSNYDKVKWSYDKNYFEKWKTGTTGFPLVDASMRELNLQGTMHNRSRLIVASFLTKNLFLDWKLGEKYFATKLIDYDPIVNNGNWQWSSGSGVDSQPYYRIFNPLLQSKRFDKDAEYIKRWIPELKDIPAKDIHDWEKKYTKYPNTYLPPMISASKSAKKTIALFEKYL